MNTSEHTQLNATLHAPSKTLELGACVQDKNSGICASSTLTGPKQTTLDVAFFTDPNTRFGVDAVFNEEKFSRAGFYFSKHI